MFVESYIEKALHLYEVYQLQMPLHLFLKEFFKNNKKLGSRDRKIIAELVYGIYRLGTSASHLELRKRMILGAFLADKLPRIFIEKTEPSLLDFADKPFHEKLIYVLDEYKIQAEVDFAWSGNLNTAAFWQFLFAPTKVFIRLRKDPHQIQEKLLKENVHVEQIQERCFALASNTPIATYLEESAYVIQDYASQQVGTFFHPKKGQTWWDCCCASGGKSIMLLDKCAQIDLTVSDIRASIINNLHVRMKRYGYQHHYKSFVADASVKINELGGKQFDHIICDVPCSGSGTWSRSPEQFYFFDHTKLDQFKIKQLSILLQAWEHLKVGGCIYYITCSIFKEENEGILEQFLAKQQVTIKSQQLISGAKFGGDHLFIAVLEKSI
jgi:16S rRNA (cytosine967-C5)-methyltransferase